MKVMHYIPVAGLRDSRLRAGAHLDDFHGEDARHDGRRGQRAGWGEVALQFGRGLSSVARGRAMCFSRQGVQSDSFVEMSVPVVDQVGGW